MARRNRVLIVVALAITSVPVCLRALPIALFVRSPSTDVDGRIRTSEDAAYPLVERA